MHCTHCGKLNVENASFCAYCGKPIDQTGTKGVWEYCEIKAYYKEGGCLGVLITFKWDCYFWGDAIGPNGSYTAGKTPNYSISAFLGGNPPTGRNERDMELSKQIHETLVKQLISDGWEPTGERGRFWWQVRFKREIIT